MKMKPKNLAFLNFSILSVALISLAMVFANISNGNKIYFSRANNVEYSISTAWCRAQP